MLTVLVGLPSAWVYYGPLPPRAQQTVDQLVATAKEALGWDKQAPFTLTDGQELGYQPPGASDVEASLLQVEMAPLPASPLDAVGPTPAVNPLEPLLARLRALGVVEYALERWGSTGELYRFHCEMPLGPGVELTQQFEAVSNDPQASVEQVVAEVASWHVARGGPMIYR